MRRIHLILFATILSFLCTAMTCDDSQPLYVIIENESDEDIRIFQVNYPGFMNHPGIQKTDDGEYMSLGYLLHPDASYKAHIIYDDDLDYDFECQILIIKESNFEKYHSDRQYDKIVFDKRYVIKNTDFQSGDITIKFKG